MPSDDDTGAMVLSTLTERRLMRDALEQAQQAFERSGRYDEADMVERFKGLLDKNTTIIVPGEQSYSYREEDAYEYKFQE